MGFLFNEILVRPIFNLLIFLYDVLPGGDLGVAIVLVTLIIRLLLVPLSIKMLVSQQQMAQLQPKLQELQAKYKGDQAKIGEATLALYKEHNVNPFSGCLPLIIQLPVIFALLSVFKSDFSAMETFDKLYGFIERPETIHALAFGFLDITKSSPILAVLTGVMQFIQVRSSAQFQKRSQGAAAQNPALKMTQQMLYFFPIMIVFISWSLPAGLVLYWFSTTVFAIIEQYYIRRRYASPAGAVINKNEGASNHSGDN